MTNTERNILWNVLTKYDNTLTSMCDSLSNILQSNEDKSDYVNILKNYRKMDLEDTKIIDVVLGKKILMAVN